jgi:signal transduction histidine kinase
MQGEDAELATLLDETARLLQRTCQREPLEAFQCFASPLLSKCSLLRVTLLVIEQRKAGDDAPVTGYAMFAGTNEATLLTPRFASEQVVLGEPAAAAEPGEHIRYIEDARGFFDGADGSGSAFGLRLSSAEVSLYFVFSKQEKEAFSEDERRFILDYTRVLSPCLKDVIVRELPELVEARNRFRTQLRTEARGEPQEVLGKIAWLWQELFHAHRAAIWLYNELSAAFVLSGQYPAPGTQGPDIIAADDTNPETACHAQMQTRRVKLAAFAESRWSHLSVTVRSEHDLRNDTVTDCREVLCVPLLYKPLFPKDAPQQCLGVIDVFLRWGISRYHDPEDLWGLAQDCGFAIQESFNFQRVRVLAEFNRLVSRTLGALTTNPVKDLKRDFYNGLIDIVRRYLSVNGVSIFQATDDAKYVTCAATTGLEGDPDLRTVRYEKGEGGTGTIFQDGKARITPRDQELLQGKFAEKKKSPNRNVPFLGAAIKAGEKVIGVIRCVEKLSPQSDEVLPFSYHDLEDLQFIVDQLAPIMEMISIQEKRERGIAVAVHDIRAPAVTLRDAAYTLRRKLKELNVYDRVKYNIDDLFNTALRLLAVVDVAGRAVGAEFRPRLQKVSLEGEIIARLKAMLYAEARSRNLTIHFEGFTGMPDVLVDPALVEQVLFNLLTNALKYSFRNTDIEILAEVMKTKRAFCIRVRNWGEPILPDEAENLFLPFYRGSAGKRCSPGLGLGLHSVKQIMEAHNGQVHITSLGSPTEFAVEFPL